MAPGHTVSSKVRPLFVVDVAVGERFLQALLESLLWSPSLTMMIFHSANMTNPSELVFQDHGFDAENLGLLYDFDAGDEVAPVDVEDDAQAALVEALEEADVAAVGDQGLRAVEKSAGNNSPIDTDLCFDFSQSTLVCIVYRRNC